MTYINSMVALLKGALTKKRTWIVFPFTITAILLSASYFVYSAWYMLVDLLSREMRKELESGNEKAGPLATAFKYMIAYSVYIGFELSRIFMLVPMAMTYFTVDICLFISSLGGVRENPFAFHNF